MPGCVCKRGGPGTRHPDLPGWWGALGLSLSKRGLQTGTAEGRAAGRLGESDTQVYYRKLNPLFGESLHCHHIRLGTERRRTKDAPCLSPGNSGPKAEARHQIQLRKRGDQPGRPRAVPAAAPDPRVVRAREGMGALRLLSPLAREAGGPAPGEKVEEKPYEDSRALLVAGRVGRDWGVSGTQEREEGRGTVRGRRRGRGMKKGSEDETGSRPDGSSNPGGWCVCGGVTWRRPRQGQW